MFPGGKMKEWRISMSRTWEKCDGDASYVQTIAFLIFVLLILARRTLHITAVTRNRPHALLLDFGCRWLEVAVGHRYDWRRLLALNPKSRDQQCCLATWRWTRHVVDSSTCISHWAFTWSCVCLCSLSIAGNDWAVRVGVDPGALGVIDPAWIRKDTFTLVPS